MNCPTCDGWQQVDGLVGGLVDCPTCTGICHACNGEGVVTLEGMQGWCPECQDGDRSITESGQTGSQTRDAGRSDGS